MKKQQRKILVLLLVLGIFHVSFSQTNNCPNLDFEQGNFNGWQGQTGSCCPVSTPSSGLVAGRHTIMTGPGIDPNSCNQIPCVAPGSTFSARLGNSSVGAQAERLLYTINVIPPSFLFIYKYAVILENPGHAASSQPRFGFRVLDATGEIASPVCGQYDVVASGSIPGFQSCGSVKYKPWTTVGMDLSAYNGQTITIEFSTGDCDAGGHYGYAYIDASCSALNIVANYCIGSNSAVLTAPPGFSYLWNSGDTTQSITVANPVAGQIDTCRLTSVTGCQISLTSLLQTAQPTANFSYTDTCNNFVFYDSSASPATSAITSWLWDFGDNTTDTLQNPTHLYTATGIFNVHLTITNATGCVDTISKQITVYPLPVAQFNFNPVCEDRVITFTDNSIIGPLTITSWQWDFGDNSSFDSTQNPSHIYVSPGTYNATLTITLTNGCIANVTHSIIIWPKPTVNFNFISRCESTAIPFSDSSVVPLPYTASNWNWYFGDNTSGTGAATSHNYADGGTYNGTLVVTTNTGCKDSATLAVKVFFNPLAGFTQNDVCVGDTMFFTNTSSVDSSSSIVDYLWVFGDGGSTSNAQNPVHYYSGSGTYYVTLVTTTIDGCSDAATDSVKVFDAPTSAFTFNNTCLLDSAKFTNTSLNPIMGTIANWSWDFGDSSSMNTTVWSPAHLYTTPGTYSVTLVTSSSTLGCPDTLKDTITVFPMPVANYGFTDMCLNHTVNFNDSSTVSNGTVTNWSWNFGDASALNTNQNPSHIYTNSGTYNVSLVSTTVNGCTNTATKNAVVHPLPNVQFLAANVCDTVIAQFNDLSTIAITDTIQSWSWNFGDNSPGNNSQNTSHLYVAPGSYSVKHIAVSGFGCSDSLTKIITIHPNPVVQFAGTDTVGCEPLCTSFQNLSTILTGNNVQWLWNFGDGNSANLPDIIHCYMNDSVFSPVSFNVGLTVTSDSGCVTSFSKNNYVTVYPVPDANFTVQPTTETILNPVISIIDASTGANFWNWNFGDLVTSSLSDPLPHIYKDTGTYVIRLIASTQYNCIDTAYNTITIEPDFVFYIPSAFTPDGDGINDTFIGKGIFISKFEMRIFDRWGNLIYKSANIDQPWDGKANDGKEVAQRDIYVYTMKVTDSKRKEHFYKGIVTLVR